MKKATLTIWTLIIFFGTTITLTAQAAKSECFQIAQNDCVEFEKGGEHTGKAPDGSFHKKTISPGQTICLSHYVTNQPQFTLGEKGPKWPTDSWGVVDDTVCFYKNL